VSTIAVLFPGQGSQEKGMGRDLAESRSEAMDLWKLAENASGLPLREIYWDGSEADMADTRALQPALTAVNLSFWLLLGEKLAPAALAGHSLGEFAALAAAGVLPIQEVLTLTALRGRLMAEIKSPGDGMAAVLKLPQDAVEDIVNVARDVTGAELRIANYNSPEQYVLSGRKAATNSPRSWPRRTGARRKSRCTTTPPPLPKRTRPRSGLRSRPR
jgi:[acyl-carrier-protein] S-malonyltransferase